MKLKPHTVALILLCVVTLIGCGGGSTATISPRISSSPTSSGPAATLPSAVPSTGPVGSSSPIHSPTAGPTVAPSPSIVSTLLTIGAGQTALRGTGGSFRWTNVQIALATTVVRWLATAGTTACTFSWKLSGPVTASGTAAAVAAAKGTGKSTISGTSSGDRITVVTDCKAWLLTFNKR